MLITKNCLWERWEREKKSIHVSKMLVPRKQHDMCWKSKPSSEPDRIESEPHRHLRYAEAHANASLVQIASYDSPQELARGMLCFGQGQGQHACLALLCPSCPHNLPSRSMIVLITADETSIFRQTCRAPRSKSLPKSPELRLHLFLPAFLPPSFVLPNSHSIDFV